MQNWHRKIIVQAAFPLLTLSVSSCASLGNFLWSGHWEDPNAREVKPAPSSNEESASSPAQETMPLQQASKPVDEPKQQVLPIDTVFARGSWFLLRTSRAFYSWTGKGQQFRLFAIELHADSNCWGSQQADRPAAEHCSDRDGPASAISRTVNGQKIESVFYGIEKAPWRTAETGTALAEGTYDLPESSGKEKRSFTLKCDADELKVQTPRALQSIVFTVRPDSNEFFVQGEHPDLFDGCTDANGIIAVYDGLGVQLGKKKCGIYRREGESTLSLLVDKAEVEFSQSRRAPDIATARVKAAELRKVAAANKAQLTLDVSGNTSHTIMTAMGKRSNGDGISSVEGIRTIDGIHHKCEGKIERMDAAWVKTAKQVCGAMLKTK